MQLETIGATPSLFRAFEPYKAQDLTLARIAASYRDRYRIFTADSDLDAQPSGALWYRTPDPAGMPVTGDWVAARVVNDADAIVEAVLPRSSLFSRRAAGRREQEQPVAANIDLIFLVSGLDGDFNPRRIERYLALAAESRVEPVIVLNKSDLCDEVAARIEEARAVAGGAPVLTANTRSPDGLLALRECLRAGSTIALLGSSGVGKSSIVNALAGDDRQRTAEVRAHDHRGRHTTSHRELIALPGGGALIDTPGMRELQLWAREESVEAVFDEIAGYAQECRYRDCTHTVEQGCGVRRALAEGRIAVDRWASYRKLIGEAEYHQVLADPLAALERKRKWKVIHKAHRARYRERR